MQIIFNQNEIIASDKSINFELLSEQLKTQFSANSFNFNINLSEITCNFELDLTEEQATIAQNIFKNHNGNAVFKITGQTSTKQQLENLDYDIKGLYKDRSFTLGELRVIDYYAQYDKITKVYSDLVVKETRKYIRDTSNGLCEYRLSSTYWYLQNGEVGHSIIDRLKPYSFAEKRAEIRERRTNLISDAEAFVLYTLTINFTAEEVMAKSVDLLSAIEDSKNLYLSGVAEPINILIGQPNNIIDTLFVDPVLSAQVKYVLSTILSYNYTQQVE